MGYYKLVFGNIFILKGLLSSRNIFVVYINNGEIKEKFKRY